MRNFKILLQYDGTRYQGWQRQISTDNTIQGKLEALLSKMCDAPIEIQGAGRTDAGVHALGQAASFHMDTDKTPEEIMAYMNAYLPEDISVISCEEKPERFHARLNAKGKVYRYCIWNSANKPVFRRKYVHQVPGELDMAAMKQAAACLLGTHDYQSFTSAKRGKKSTVRTVDSIEIERSGEEVLFTFKGNGFLYHMVRIMMGTLIETGLGIRKAEEIPRILEAKDRSKSGHLIPGKGLTLMEVIYDN
ncbi:MAG: tRNA pseudouridine(38-40) synthase TruA [Lachnospiraceae bacterium]|nr:tRNA pseudouridine(38-40) synthase TruA [Lachnospiraceae bacterium]